MSLSADEVVLQDKNKMEVKRQILATNTESFIIKTPYLDLRFLLLDKIEYKMSNKKQLDKKIEDNKKLEKDFSIYFSKNSTVHIR